MGFKDVFKKIGSGFKNVFSSLGGAVTDLAVNFGLALLTGALFKPKLESSGQKGLQTSVQSPIEPRTVVYGETRVGGPWIFMEETNIDDQDDTQDTNKWLHGVLAITTHPVEEISWVYIDGKPFDIRGCYSDNVKKETPPGSNIYYADYFYPNTLAPDEGGTPYRGDLRRYIPDHEDFYTRFDGSGWWSAQFQPPAVPSPGLSDEAADDERKQVSKIWKKNLYFIPVTGKWIYKAHTEGGNLWSNLYNDEDFVRSEEVRKSIQRAGQDYTYATVGGTVDTSTIPWNFNHRVERCSYLYLRLKYDKEYTRGIPNVSVLVKGKPIYNPLADPTKYIKDTSNDRAAYSNVTTYYVGNIVTHSSIDYVCIQSGTGQQPDISPEYWVSRTHELPDYNNDSYGVQLRKEGTWTYSANWALCTLDYLLDPYYGLKVSTTGDVVELDWDSINKAVIDACDGGYFFRTKENAPTLEGSILDYVDCNGAFKVDVTPIDILETLLAAGLGELAYAQGRHHLFANTYREPDGDPTDDSAVILDESYIADGGISVATALPTSDTFNVVTGTYVQVYNPKGTKRSYDAVEFDPIRQTVYIAEDEEELPREVSFPFTHDKDQAEKLAASLIEKPRRSFIIEANCNVKAWKFKVGDIVYVSLDRLGLDDTIQNCYTIDSSSPYTTSYKQFKVSSMKFNEDATVNVTLQEQDLGLYNPELVPNDPVPNTGDLLLTGVGTQANPPTNLQAVNLFRYGPDGSTTSYIKLSFDGPNVQPSSPYGPSDLNYNYDSISLYRIKWTKRSNLLSPIDSTDIEPDGDPWEYSTIIANRNFNTASGIDAAKQSLEIFDLDNNEEYLISVQAVPESGVPSDWSDAYIFHNTVTLNVITITSVDVPANGLGFITFDIYYDTLDFDTLDKVRIFYNFESPYEQPGSPFESGGHEGVYVISIPPGEISPARVTFPTDQIVSGKFWFQLVDRSGVESNLFAYTEFAQAGSVDTALNLATNQFNFINTGLSQQTTSTTSADSKFVGRCFLKRTDLVEGDNYAFGANVALDDFNGGSPSGGAFVKLEWFDDYDVSLGSVSTTPEPTQGLTVKYVEGVVPTDAYYFIVTVEKEATVAACRAVAFDYMVTLGTWKFYRPPIDERFIQTVIDPTFEDEFFWTGDFSIQYGAGTSGGLMRINQQVGVDSSVYSLRRAGPDFWDTTAIDYDRVKVKVRFRWVGGTTTPFSAPIAYVTLKIADAGWSPTAPDEGDNVVVLEKSLGISATDGSGTFKVENTWYEQAFEFSIDNAGYLYQRSLRAGFKVEGIVSGEDPGYIEIDTLEVIVLPRELPQTPWVPDANFENSQWWEWDEQDNNWDAIVTYDANAGVNNTGAMIIDYGPSGITYLPSNVTAGSFFAYQRSPERGFTPREQDQLATVGMTLSARFRVKIEGDLPDSRMSLECRFHDYYGYVSYTSLSGNTGTISYDLDDLTRFPRDEWVEINENIYIDPSVKLANPDRNLNFQVGFNSYTLSKDIGGRILVDMIEIEPMSASFGQSNESSYGGTLNEFQATGLVPVPPLPHKPINPTLFLREDGVWANPAGSTTGAPGGGYTTEIEFSPDGTNWNDTWTPGDNNIRTREVPNIDPNDWPVEPGDIPLPHQVGRWAGRASVGTYENDRRTVHYTSDGSVRFTPTNFGTRTRKLYCEAIMQGTPNSAFYTGMPQLFIEPFGVAKNWCIRTTNTQWIIDYDVYTTNTNDPYNTGIAPTTDSAGESSDVISLAIDPPTRKLWIGINGVWVGPGTQNPETNAGGWDLSDEFYEQGTFITGSCFNGTANDGRRIIWSENISYPIPFGYVLPSNPTLSGLLQITSSDPRAGDVPLLLTFENKEAAKSGEFKTYEYFRDRSIYESLQVLYDDGVGDDIWEPSRYVSGRFNPPSGGNTFHCGQEYLEKVNIYLNERFAIPEVPRESGGGDLIDYSGDFTVEYVVLCTRHDRPHKFDVWQIGGTGQTNGWVQWTNGTIIGKHQGQRDPSVSPLEGKHYITLYDDTTNNTGIISSAPPSGPPVAMNEQWNHMVFERETDLATGTVTIRTVCNGIVIEELESDSTNDIECSLGHNIATVNGMTQFAFAYTQPELGWSAPSDCYFDQIRVTVNGCRYGAGNYPSAPPDKKWTSGTIEVVEELPWTEYNTCCAGDNGPVSTKLQFSSGDGTWHDSHRSGDTLARLIEFTPTGAPEGSAGTAFIDFYNHGPQGYSIIPSSTNNSNYYMGDSIDSHRASSNVTFNRNSGKTYFEIVPTVTLNNSLPYIGFWGSQIRGQPTGSYIPTVGDGGITWDAGGNVWQELPSTGTDLTGYQAGSVLGMAWDWGARAFWISVNGVWSTYTGEPGDYDNAWNWNPSPTGEYVIVWNITGNYSEAGAMVWGSIYTAIPDWDRLAFYIPPNPLYSVPTGYQFYGSSSSDGFGATSSSTGVKELSVFPIGAATTGSFLEFSDDGSSWHTDYAEGDTYARLPKDSTVNTTTSGNSWSAKDSYWHRGIFDNATASGGGMLLTDDGFYTTGKHYWEVSYVWDQLFYNHQDFYEDTNYHIVGKSPYVVDSSVWWYGEAYGAAIGLLGPETNIPDPDRIGVENFATIDFTYRAFTIESRLTYHYLNRLFRRNPGGDTPGYASFWENGDRTDATDDTPMKWGESWGLAVDIDNGLMWIIGDDGTVFPSGDPAAGTGGYSIPSGEEYRFFADADLNTDAGSKIKLSSTSKNGVPSGFTFHSAAQAYDTPDNFDAATLYLPFDTDINDEGSSPQETMTAVGSAAQSDTAGYIGFGGLNNGTTTGSLINYVRTSIDSGTVEYDISSSTPFSVKLNAKWDGTNGDQYQVLFGNGVGSMQASGSFSLRVDTVDGEAGVYFNSTSPVITATNIVPSEYLEYLIERDDSNVIRFYVGGIYKGKVTNSAAITMQGIIIGSANGQSATFSDWNGYIDEFIWMPDLSSPYSATPFAVGAETSYSLDTEKRWDESATIAGDAYKIWRMGGCNQYFGSGTAATSLGKIGDVYTDTTNKDVYQKTTTTVWTLRYSYT